MCSLIQSHPTKTFRKLTFPLWCIYTVYLCWPQQLNNHLSPCYVSWVRRSQSLPCLPQMCICFIVPFNSFYELLTAASCQVFQLYGMYIILTIHRSPVLSCHLYIIKIFHYLVSILVWTLKAHPVVLNVHRVWVRECDAQRQANRQLLLFSDL